AGDPARRITLVAVCGGSGDEFLPQAREMGVDVYLTGDLKHHKASDHLLEGGPALIDAGHWATEQPWLVGVARWGRSTRRWRSSPTARRTCRSSPRSTG